MLHRCKRWFYGRKGQQKHSDQSDWEPEGAVEFEHADPAEDCIIKSYYIWLVVSLPSILFSQKYWESHHPN